jgi:hypothetical protein
MRSRTEDRSSLCTPAKSLPRLQNERSQSVAPGIDDSDTFHAFHTAHRNGENSRLRDTAACGPPSLPGVITAPQPRAKRAAINELGPQRIERDALRIATGHLEVTLSTRPLGCEDGQCFVGGEIELRHLSAEISIQCAKNTEAYRVGYLFDLRLFFSRNGKSRKPISPGSSP